MDYSGAEEQSRVVLEKVVRVEELVSNLSKIPMDQYSSHLSPLDQAKLSIFKVYAIYSLLHNYCEISGADVSVIQKELQRVKSYFNKLESFIKKKDPSFVGPKEDQEQRTRLDVEASKRMVKHHTKPADQTQSVARLSRKKKPLKITTPPKKRQAKDDQADTSPTKKEKVENI